MPLHFTLVETKILTMTFKKLYGLTQPTLYTHLLPTSCALMTGASQFITVLLFLQSGEHTVTKNTGPEIILSKSPNWICQHPDFEALCNSSPEFRLGKCPRQSAPWVRLRLLHLRPLLIILMSQTYIIISL